MIYVEEDTDEENLWRLITDVNGKEWFYKETRLETEYVWRNDGIEDRRHVSKAFTSEEEAYRSIPDVLGAYSWNSMSTTFMTQNRRIFPLRKYGNIRTGQLQQRQMVHV